MNTDSSKIIACANNHLNVYDFFTHDSIFWTITSTNYPACEFSDVDDKFGFVNGNSISVIDSSFSTFYFYEDASLPSDTFRSIKFLPGDPYPITIMMGHGIVKTS